MWGTLPDHLVGMRGGYVPKVCAVWKGPRRPNNNSIGAFHTVIGSYKVCFIRLRRVPGPSRFHPGPAGSPARPTCLHLLHVLERRPARRWWGHLVSERKSSTRGANHLGASAHCVLQQVQPRESGTLSARGEARCTKRGFVRTYLPEVSLKVVGIFVWGQLCCSKPLAPARHHFRDVGLRVVPKQGTAILWPNVDFDNV